MQNINRYSANIPSQILTQYRACMPGDRGPDVTIGNGAGLTFASSLRAAGARAILHVNTQEYGWNLIAPGLFVGELHHLCMAPDSRRSPTGGLFAASLCFVDSLRPTALTSCNYFESILDTYGTDSISNSLINVTFVTADIDRRGDSSSNGV